VSEEKELERAEELVVGLGEAVGGVAVGGAVGA